MNRLQLALLLDYIDSKLQYQIYQTTALSIHISNVRQQLLATVEHTLLDQGLTIEYIPHANEQ